jgi:hypothetical protein
MMLRKISLLTCAIGLVVVTSGCGTTAKKTVVNAAMSSSDTQRAQLFEATARILDEKPEYTDEFYAVAKKHPVTLRRFTEDAMKDIDDPTVTDIITEVLIENPKALEKVIVATIDEIGKNKEARKAVNRAVESRAPAMADIVTDSEPAMVAAFIAAVKATSKKPQARRALSTAMQRTSDTLAQYMRDDPKTMRVMIAAIVKAYGNDKAALRDLVKELLSGGD